MHAKRRGFFLFRQYGKLDICIAQKIPPTIIKQQNDRFCPPPVRTLMENGSICTSLYSILGSVSG